MSKTKFKIDKYNIRVDFTLEDDTYYIECYDEEKNITIYVERYIKPCDLKDAFQKICSKILYDTGEDVYE